MKKTLIVVLVVLAAVFIFLALGREFPIYSKMLPMLLFLFFIDGYLWLSVRKWIFSLTTMRRNVAFAFYWLPEFLLICCIITGIFIPFVGWNIPLRTLVPGVIFILFVFKIIPFIFLVVANILQLFTFGFMSFSHSGTRWHDVPKMIWLRMTGWVTSTLFLIVMILGIVWWNYDYRVINQAIILPELPASFDGLRILQISDIHLGSWASSKELSRAVDLVNAQHADLIFFTGDMANYTTLDVLPFENILTRIHSPKYGIFAILGNHDYGQYVTWPSDAAEEQDMQDLFRFYKRLGWKLLLNEHSILRNGDDSIAVLGVQNWGKSYRFQKLGDIPAAQKGVENMPVQLLLSHDPSFWDSIICHQFRNIDITFSGHTHGFQFGIECCGIKWSPAKYLYPQWGGLYERPVPGSHPQYIYVNRGLGSLGYPGRIGILPEITVITLKRR